MDPRKEDVDEIVLRLEQEEREVCFLSRVIASSDSWEEAKARVQDNINFEWNSAVSDDNDCGADEHQFLQIRVGRQTPGQVAHTHCHISFLWTMQFHIAPKSSWTSPPRHGRKLRWRVVLWISSAHGKQALNSLRSLCQLCHH